MIGRGSSSSLLLLIAVLLAAGWAGCLGLSDEGDVGGSSLPTSGSAEAGDRGSSPDPSEPQAEQAQDDGADPSTRQQNETMRGSETGLYNGAVLVGTGSSGAETFNVSEPALRLGLHLNATCSSAPTCEPTLRIDLYPPGCQRAETNPGLPACAISDQTSKGSFSWETKGPAEGTWSFDLWRAEPGFGEIRWVLDIVEVLSCEGTPCASGAR